ncbi:MAG: hypothetical protein QOG22_3597 [Pseudonocardiales bacterium]|nr:hypothetical protein [Pseudonocardiales bacterium]
MDGLTKLGTTYSVGVSLCCRPTTSRRRAGEALVNVARRTRREPFRRLGTRHSRHHGSPGTAAVRRRTRGTCHRASRRGRPGDREHDGRLRPLLCAWRALPGDRPAADCRRRPGGLPRRRLGSSHRRPRADQQDDVRAAAPATRRQRAPHPDPGRGARVVPGRLFHDRSEGRTGYRGVGARVDPDGLDAPGVRCRCLGQLAAAVAQSGRTRAHHGPRLAPLGHAGGQRARPRRPSRHAPQRRVRPRTPAGGPPPGLRRTADRPCPRGGRLHHRVDGRRTGPDAPAARCRSRRHHHRPAGPAARGADRARPMDAPADHPRVTAPDSRTDIPGRGHSRMP